jgi:hypothetical protein
MTKAAHAVASLRHRYEAKAQRAERGLISIAAGWGLAELQKKAILPATFAGVPTTPLMGAALLLLAAKSSGATRRLADAAGDATLAVYGYKVGLAGSLIAGDGDDMV